MFSPSSPSIQVSFLPSPRTHLQSAQCFSLFQVSFVSVCIVLPFCLLQSFIQFHFPRHIIFPPFCVTAHFQHTMLKFMSVFIRWLIRTQIIQILPHALLISYSLTSFSITCKTKHITCVPPIHTFSSVLLTTSYPKSLLLVLL